MPGPLYGRWVPTSPAANSQATTVSSTTPEGSGSTHRERDSPQNARGIKKDEVDRPAGTPHSSEKQKKRKRDSNIEERNDPADEITPKKHKSILSKFEKVTKKAQEVRKRQAEDGDADDASAQGPEEVLRGMLCGSALNYME